MRSLTLALTYYENPLMLLEQQRVIESYPDHIRSMLTVIVVDDGSLQPAGNYYLQPNGYRLKIYRILEDRPWNHLGARNLAMHHASEGWCLMLDIDHVLPVESAEMLWASRALDEPGDAFYYIPGRQLPDGTDYKPHPNTYILTRSLYWEIGGCNEDFAGYYGTDGLFRKRIATMATRVPMPLIKLTVYNLAGEDIGGVCGAATPLPRKGSKYHARRYPEFKRRMEAAALTKPTNPLRFPWAQVV